MPVAMPAMQDNDVVKTIHAATVLMQRRRRSMMKWPRVACVLGLVGETPWCDGKLIAIGVSLLKWP
ncbi:hypothetical protein ACHAW6_001322 [Cyclotella cf. meneghiniana]